MDNFVMPMGEIKPDAEADRINEEHKLAVSGAVDAVTHAWKCGKLLVEKRPKVEARGIEWIPWVEHNCEFTYRSAFRYSEVFKRYPSLPDLTGLSSDVKSITRILGREGVLQDLSPDYYTPAKYIDAVREVLGQIDLDPASCKDANDIVRAKKFYTEAQDGLRQEWVGRVFLNPPYGKLVSEFAAKLYDSLGSGVSEAILLVNSRATDADWFQPCFNGAICFTDHRIDFNSPNEKISSSTHGSCFVYFGPQIKEFANAFAKFGNVVIRYQPEDDPGELRQADLGLQVPE